MTASEALDALRAQIPDANCKGLCQAYCGPVLMTKVERQRIIDRYGIALGHGETKLGTMDCPALTTDGRCSVYDERPLTCRLWGATTELPCPHGCQPTFGLLSREVAGQIIRDGQLVDMQRRWELDHEESR